MSGGNKKFVIDNQSQYFLHLSEGPSVTITTVIFNSKNYDLWQKALRTALRSKNKLGFIDGLIKKPKDDPSEINAWKTVNSMICLWILNVVDPKLRTSIAYVETAREMWTNLQKRYAIGNTPKIHQLKADLATCKQGELDVVEFYSKLSGMWSELDNYTKLSHCICGKCECSLNKTITKMFEEERTHQFVMGLTDESFSTIRSQVLARDPLPSLDVIFNIIQQEEFHRRVMMSREQRSESVMAFAARERTTPNERPTCRHCGKYGHAESGCYKLIGYPANCDTRWRGRGQRGGRGRGGRLGRGAG